MRRLLLTENITVDGRLEMLDEWFDPSPDENIGHWPYHTDEPAGAYLDDVSAPTWPSQ